VVAPLTANTLSKIAGGICDNLLTTVICALPATKKIIFAPAMNTNMWKNPIIQENTEKLKKLKRYIFLNPQSGLLACGDYGQGRMPEPEEIYAKIKASLK
jgi:phosphopantothenoylcysteine decarboxylase/phosphopantothenate--cysteine ligase